MPTKTVYLYVAGAATPFTWQSVSVAQATDVVARWNTARTSGSPDALVFTQGGYEQRLDLTKVTALLVSV